MSGFVTPTTPNVTDYLTFIRNGLGIGPAFLPDDSLWVTTTFNMAMATVNLTLTAATVGTSGPYYTLAVYNFAADRLLNFALDQPGQSYFKDKRAALGLNSFAAGLVAASGDQGTSQTLEVIEAVKRMTITDLSMMKTPYGRAYLDFAQAYGPTIWGLT